MKVAEAKERLNPVLKETALDADIIALVKDIEGSIQTTQNHYGRYMAFLSLFNKDKMALYVMSEALKLAGANVSGVQSAMMILNG